MENKPIELREYHDAITAAIKDAVPELDEITYYAIKRDRIRTPSVIIELKEWTPADKDDGTGMHSWDFSWSAYVFVKFCREIAKLELRELAMKVCMAVEENRFGIQASPANVTLCEQDDFDPEWDAYEVFRIDWTQTARVGVNVWKADNETHPEHLMVSESPDIGIPHEDDYLEVT
jgi:hypothetical protein